MKGTVATIQRTMENVTKENKQLKETLLDVQSRSMQENQIFSGIPERDNDDTEQTMRDFSQFELFKQKELVKT